MKFSLDKKTITLDQVEDAKTMLSEFKGYAKDSIGNDSIMDCLIRNAIAANSNRIDDPNHCGVERIIEISECIITQNRYRLTAWINCIVKVDYQTIVEMSFDGMDALQYSESEKVDACITVYRNNNN